MKAFFTRFRRQPEDTPTPPPVSNGGLKVGHLIGAGLATSLVVLAALAYATYRQMAVQVEARQAEVLTARGERISAALAARAAGIAESVEAAARDPRTVAAVRSGDANFLNERARVLAASLPGGLRVRFLAPDAHVPDESSIPRLSYAGLELARQAGAGKRPPLEVHFPGTPDQHLAVARPVLNGDTVVGVLSASFDARLPASWLAAEASSARFLELRQTAGGAVLSSAGGQTPAGSADATLPVPGTAWELAYWPAEADHPVDTGTATGWAVTFGIAAALLAAVWAITGLVLGRLLHRDLVMLVRHVFGILSHKREQAYTVRLAEFRRAARALDEQLGIKPQGYAAPAPVDDAQLPPAPISVVTGESPDVLFLGDHGISVEEQAANGKGAKE